MHGAVCDFALPRNVAKKRLPMAPSTCSTSLHCNGSLAFEAMIANVDHVLHSELNDERFYMYGPCHSLGSFGLAMLAHFSEMVSVHSLAFSSIKRVLRDCIIEVALGVCINPLLPSPQNSK